MRRNISWMQINVFCLMIFIGIIVSPAIANYQSQAGRWMQQEKLGMMPESEAFYPVAQYGDSINAYQAFNFSPQNLIDPLGLFWYVQRRGAARANAIVLISTDTAEGLAKRVKLDLSEFKKWMQLTSETIKTVDGEKTLKELEKNDQICPMQIVTVPNTFSIIKGDMNHWQRLGQLADLYMTIWAAKITMAFEKRGYQVLWYEDASPDDIKNAVTEDWWGIGMFGHGQEGYLITKSEWGGWWATEFLGSEYISGARILDNKQDMFKLGGTIGYMCHADEGGWSRITFGKSYLAHGILSAASGPRGLGWWGSWDSLVGDMTGE